MKPRRLVGTLAGLAGAAALTAPTAGTAARSGDDPRSHRETATPIQHLVVIFQENISFDHYFGTYPYAQNGTAGEPEFHPRPGTPTVNGYGQTDAHGDAPNGLMTRNPNLSNPQRLTRSEALTCDMNHDYTPEQSAADHGAQDMYVEHTSGPAKDRGSCDRPPRAATPGDNMVMDYYDGNTVTALWNYAQHFAMSDNSYSTSYGPSSPGALNLVAGNTFPVRCAQAQVTGTTPEPNGDDPAVYDGYGDVLPCPSGLSTNPGGSSTPGGAGAGSGHGTTVGDPDQYFDKCSNPAITAAMGGPNIGDVLTRRDLTWGWFNGGFGSPDYVPGRQGTYDPNTVCTSAHYNIGAGPQLDGKPCTPGVPVVQDPNVSYCQKDYSAHHEPFQYYQSTSNPMHLPPSSVEMIGRTDQANHQYDLRDFWAAAEHGTMPAVSFLKASRYQDGHPRNSDPLDEQHFLVQTINRLQRLPTWKDTAVVIAYDDSDGWYDHALAPALVQSQTPLDTLTGTGQCGTRLKNVPVSDDGRLEQARCGYGMRQPFLVISPWARRNAVDHTLTDQSSVTRFIEDNWLHGQRLGNGSTDAYAGTLGGLFDFRQEGDAGSGRLFLDPVTGQPAREGDSGGNGVGGAPA